MEGRLERMHKSLEGEAGVHHDIGGGVEVLMIVIEEGVTVLKIMIATREDGIN